MRRSPRLAGFAAAAVALALVAAPAGAALYKWVDEKGVVHYSDQMPPEAVNKGNTQLNPQGIPIRKVDPATSPEALKAREAEQEKRKDATRLQQEQARRDRALLDSYTTEADIDLARARAMRTVDEALKSQASYRAQLQKRKEALLERKAAAGTGPVPVEVERDLASVDAELARDAAMVAQKTRQLEEIKAKYDGDKERWRQIAAPPAPAAPAAAPPTPAPKPQP